MLVDSLLNQLPIGVVKSISALQWRAPWLRKAYLLAASRYTGRDGVIQRGPAQGLRFNSGPACNAGFLLGTYEPCVQEIYAALIRPGMTVYDVGANVGFLSVLAAKLAGSHGRVICFEPLPANADAIEHNCSINGFQNMTVIREALGRKQERAEFLVSANVGWGRLAGLPAGAPGDLTEKLMVPVNSLDHWLRELAPPDVIKIDIEGGEIEMLEGARQMLSEIRPIVLVELHGTNAGVDRILTEASYRSYVVGRACSVVDARWSALVLSAPSESMELGAVARALAGNAARSR
jgi:FkbM family methyltransferase